MKNKKLKIVRRIGMPETNSSSSHAVSISTSPDNLVSPGDKDWDIEITEDGVLRIPGGRDFGWEYFKTNSILIKLQYLCGIYCYDIRSDSGKKKITRLKKILRQIFGVKDVEFLWITDFSERLKEAEDPEDVYYSYPEIDHNSHDIFEEITENINVIRTFLLSRDSWLFGGNDNSDAPAGFYSKSICNKHVSAIISIELGGEIGRVDWEIENLFDKVGSDAIKNTITKEDSFNILNEIFYDQKEKTWIIPSTTANRQNKNFLKDLIIPDGLFSIFRSPIIYKNSKLYILFTRCKFNDVWIEIKKGKGKDYYEYDQITKEAVDSCKEGEDYILFPIKIKLLDYGNYEI
jgi:hypothetical protein